MATKNLSRSSRDKPLTTVFILLALCFAVAMALHPVSASASEADDLAKTIDKELRSAERLMFNGKKEESDQTLSSAQTMLTELMAMDPDNIKLKSLDSKYEKIRKDLDKRMGITTQTYSARPLPAKPVAPAATTAAPAATKAPVAETQSDKLPGGVTKRLGEINAALKNAETGVAENQISRATHSIDRVPDLFDEIDTMYNGQFSTDHPDYVTTRARYAQVQAGIETGVETAASAEADAVQAKEARQAEANQWIERFSPYISGSFMPEDHEPETPLIFPGTANPEKIAAMQVVYEEARAVYAEYEQSGFASTDAPWPLGEAASKLEYALEGFESSTQSAMSGYTRDAESNLDRALAQLSKSDWKNDPKAVPPIIDKDWMERINSLMQNLETTLTPDDPKLLELKAKQANVMQLDQENRQSWMERIRVRPEIYTAGDLGDIRAKAESIVEEKNPGAKILRVSVYQDEWKEESVIESTDSTNTAIRHRTTRMINVQVAAKENDTVLLHTLHIAKDKQSDDNWTRLYGHIMYSDKMLEANVDK